MNNRRGWILGLLGLLGCAAPLAVGAEPLRYNRDIRPILSENCFACHGPDSAARKAELRLDRRDDAISAKAFIPGKSAESELVKRILTADADDLMPPPESHKKLTAKQKATLKQWVEEGAEYEPHWSFIPPQRAALPKVKNTAWARNAIDHFVLARLEAAGLQPAPEADRYTLARRLSLDLTGLPPNPKDVEAFVNDKSPQAYEKFVDRLMESQRWGEHRARYWLDAARYADTHGLHFDNYREMWTYRDWVINAFNRNVRFDQFTLEQLAGDLLPSPTLDQLIASGFNRCNITTNEGGTIPEENLVGYTRDRTETTATVFLGLTAGCAVCHDHKFDPLTQKNFYELAAFFNNTTQGALDGNVQNTPPIIPVVLPADRPKIETLNGQIAAAKAELEKRKPAAMIEFDQWLETAKPQVAGGSLPGADLLLHVPLGEGQGNTVNFTSVGKGGSFTSPTALTWTDGYVTPKAYATQHDSVVDLGGSGDVESDKGFSYGAWVKLTGQNTTGAILGKMDDGPGFRGWDLWIEGGKVGTHIISTWSGDALKVVSQNPIKAGEWTHVFVTYDGSKKAAGVQVFVNGVAQKTAPQADALSGTIRTPITLKVGQRNNSSKINGLGIHDVRVYARALPPQEVLSLGKQRRMATLLAKGGAERTDAEKNELFDWWQGAFDKTSQALNAKLAELEAQRTAIQNRATIAHVMQEKKEEAMAFVLFRGEYDQRRDPVKASTPQMLPPMAADLPRNRLGFAKWLLTPEHPLTSRVTVNRFWQEVFGTGLVRTSGDFGISGEQPSHPELLDWLSVEFRESGWDIKRLFKLMVTSAAYRQSAAATADKIEKDRDNRLLSRGPRFRMDAEMIRDYALTSSELLVEKIGGPSVKPYQPDNIWNVVGLGGNTSNYQRDTGEGLYRRSVYTFWKRMAPPPAMEILNAPNREVCSVRRERTNTPLQSLVTLNDPQFVEAARRLAEQTLKQGGDTAESRADYMTRRLLLRTLAPDERAVVLASAKELLGYYQSNPSDAAALIAVGETKPDAALDPAALAGWTMLANQLLNLDEVLNK